jgi:DHA1 family bicyclomycin/chloramphenicol resistance-like MFS transporter
MSLDPQMPSRGRLAALLVVQIAFGILAMTICLPSMQEWGAIFKADAGSVQMTFSGYLITYGGLQLLYGPLSDRFGRRRLLLFGLALSSLAPLAGSLARGIEPLIAARVFQGAGAAACMVVGRAALQDLFHGPERTRWMAYVGMAMGLCPPTGTVIGGQLHVHFGWASNLLLMGLVGAVLFALAWRLLPVQEKHGDPKDHWLRQMVMAYGRLAREPAFLIDTTVLAATSAAFYVFLGSAPFVLGSYGIGPGTVGLYIMLAPLSYFVGNFMASRLIRLKGPVWLAWMGQTSTVGGIALVLVLAWTGLHHPLAFVGPLMLMGLGHGMLMPPTLAATVGVIPALAGAAAAVAGVSQQLLGALGGYWAGAVRHDTPVPATLLMMAFTLTAVLAQALSWRRARAHAAKRMPADAAPDAQVTR